MPLKAKRPGNGDDYAALAEWMRRRLESGPPWADLVLIDGGRGQVSAVQRIVRESNAEGLFLLAASPRPATTWGAPTAGPGTWATGFSCPAGAIHCRCATVPPSYCFSSISAIRRTISSSGGTRRARAGAALSAELLRIPGVGKATARLLWDHFKALDAIIAATPAQLAAIPGIGPRKAEALAGSLKRLKE